MLLLLGFLSLCVTSVFSVDCSVNGDGVFEIGCSAYVVCTNGHAEQHECTGGMVYNEVTQTCDSPDNVGPPCNLPIDCSGKPDGSYPDPGCQSYYLCMYGDSIGRQICPDGLIWDSILHLCNWPQQVCPPCGTKDCTSTTSTWLVG